jgi:uncharacterized membrane protein YdbT with pleckstrin-like domain
MEEAIIRMSRRRMVLSLVLASLVALAVATLYFRNRESLAWWILLVAVLPFAGPLAGWLDSRRMTLTLGGGVVRAETGLWRKQQREIALSRVAHVGVERSFAQRLYGVGTVIIDGEGAGERIVTGEVDGPNRLAKRIREAAQLAGATAAARAWTEKENEEDE